MVVHEMRPNVPRNDLGLPEPAHAISWRLPNGLVMADCWDGVRFMAPDPCRGHPALADPVVGTTCVRAGQLRPAGRSTEHPIGTISISKVNTP